MKTTISEGQNIVDMAIQLTGSVEGLFGLLESNDLAIDAELSPGQVLEIDASQVVSRDIVSYLSSNGIRVNTGAQLPSEEGDFNSDFNSDFSI